MRHTRRVLLAGAVTAAAALTGEPGRKEPRPEARAELERYLRLASRYGAGRWTASLGHARDALPESLAARLESQADEYGVSRADLSSYTLLEALSLPRDFLRYYLPRGLAFVSPRQPGQPGLLGAAFLPTMEPLAWRTGGGYAGLASGGRAGRHMGSNAGLSLVTLCGPDATWLGPGVPPSLAAEHCLGTTRSLEAARQLLEGLPTPRPCLHLLYDNVTGEAMALPHGESAPVDSGLPVLVAGSLGTGGTENVEALTRHLDANVGWLTLEKSAAILEASLPDSIVVVLDPDNRRGLLSGTGGVRSLAL